ncbi:MAG: uracil-DNA glycosylase [Rhodocyclaceae bacterium]|nr:uracil-DNA glycosylase [Rhodocyclaceae bacterium]
MTPWQSLVVGQLGLGPLWRLRSRPLEDTPTIEPERAREAPRRPDPAPAIVPSTSRIAAPPAPQARSVSTGSTEVGGVPVSVPAGADWDLLERQIRECTACELHRRRKQAVPGVGDRHPRWLLVGEGPGAEEDRRGEPFVGPAGRLLDAMLAAVGLSREAGVFIANSVKCRPPGNRTPEAAEIATCFPYLKRQVELLGPRLIVALGRPAAQSLLNREVRIADVRGQTFEFAGIPVLVTYHPAYLLRNPHDKGKAWEDLCRARSLSASD